MRTSLALSFASVVILAFASGCSDESTQAPAGDIVAPLPPAAIPGAATPAAAPKEDAPATATTDSVNAAAGLTMVHGKFAEASAAALDNARVIAIAEDDTTVWSYLDAQGEFTLSLPVHASYRIVFVNQLSGGGQVKIGQMSFKTGTKISQWFGANAAGDIDFGSVSANGTVETSATNHTDDPPTQTDDGRADDGTTKLDGKTVALDAINVCVVWPSVQLFAGTNVGDAWAAPKADDDGPHDDDKTCAHWNGGLNGAVIWGAPWSIGLNGQITVAGGFKIEGGISGGFNANAGFGFGFYGGYSGGYTASSFYGSYSGGFSGGWAMSSSFSVSSSISGSVCVTAQSCAGEFSCTAGKCEKR